MICELGICNKPVTNRIRYSSEPGTDRKIRTICVCADCHALAMELYRAGCMFELEELDLDQEGSGPEVSADTKGVDTSS